MAAAKIKVNFAFACFRFYSNRARPSSPYQQHSADMEQSISLFTIQANRHGTIQGGVAEITFTIKFSFTRFVAECL
jgi:hypothetical protein